MTTIAPDSIDIRHVGKRYAQRDAALVVLDDVSLHVRAGEFVTIVGASGCGKSTLLRLIAGLDADYDGEIRAGDVLVRDTSLQRGIVFQDHRLFPWLTVAQNIEAALRNAPLDAPAKRRAVADHIALVGLNGFEHAYPHQLSGGMAQRVAIARGLVNRPRVLLLDEPFGALDAKVRKELRGWLRRLHDDLHISTIFVTHDQEEALEVADRIVVLNHGRVEQVGSPQDVYDHPQSAFVYEFLGAANRLPGTVAARGFVAEGAAAPIEVDADFAGPAHAYVRPHDLQLWPTGEGRADGIAVDVRRVVPLGGSVRVELEARAGGALEAELDRDAWRALALQVGDGATAVPRAVRVFPAR
ncbi:ABC transporter ATP-binding protein [Paraburkholderia sp. Se-20369]|nr:ABC transporter ATP-binding protein [Paraburkholderia sp. Se-20369]